jgi:hypothetical protein
MIICVNVNTKPQVSLAEPQSTQRRTEHDILEPYQEMAVLMCQVPCSKKTAARSPASSTLALLWTLDARWCPNL